MIPKFLARPAVASTWSCGRGGVGSSGAGRRSLHLAGRLILVLADRIDLRVPVASSAAFEVAWRSVRSDVVARVLWGPAENIAADIRLVGLWRLLSGPCNGPLRTSTCIVARQPSAQITLHPTCAALADIQSQRTMRSACGGALPASSALRTEPASVQVSLRPPGCSPTTDLARFGSAVQRHSSAASRSVTGSAVLVRTADRGDISRFGNGRRSIPGRVRSCDNASSGACEVRAATSPPRSGGSGLYVPPRGHDQGRARERSPPGAPVPQARLEE